ncbi:hypothetical protein ZWY2020_028785 [Hordeum vulgare]|nr:hypothetical protein ZWY2020_028785 [Hordeum vulgare]
MESSVQSWWVLPLTLLPAISGGQHDGTTATTLAALATSFAYLAVLAFLAWAAAALLYWAHPGGPAWGRYWRGGARARACAPSLARKGSPSSAAWGWRPGWRTARWPPRPRAGPGPSGSWRCRSAPSAPSSRPTRTSPRRSSTTRPSPRARSTTPRTASCSTAPSASPSTGPTGARPPRRVGPPVRPEAGRRLRSYRARVAGDVVAELRGAGAGVVEPAASSAAPRLYYIMRFVFGKEYDVAAPSSSGEVEELLGMVHEGYELLGKENCATTSGARRRRPSGYRGPSTSSKHKKMVAVLFQEMIFRGTDAMAVLMEWTMARLVLHRDVQAKVHRELDEVVGRSSPVGESSLLALPYLQALIKEALRAHLPGRCVVAPQGDHRHVRGRPPRPRRHHGHGEPVGQSRDPEVWDAPLEFRPERFLAGGEAPDVSVLGADGRLVPFGSGRRSCPGVLAMTTVTAWMAALLQEFEGAAAAGVDLSEVLRLSCEMAALPRSGAPEGDVR